jgi:hypothetical protein
MESGKSMKKVPTRTWDAAETLTDDDKNVADYLDPAFLVALDTVARAKERRARSEI